MKDTITLPAVPNQVSSPLSRAELVAILLGSLVVTNGDMGAVVKDVSSDHKDGGLSRLSWYLTRQ